MDSREGLLEGGDAGPAIVPGRSGESTLIHAIRHEEGMAMPPKKPKLPESVVADIAKWVDLGATYPSAGEAAAVVRLGHSEGSDPLGISAGEEGRSVSCPQ